MVVAMGGFSLYGLGIPPEGWHSSSRHGAGAWGGKVAEGHGGAGLHGARRLGATSSEGAAAWG